MTPTKKPLEESVLELLQDRLRHGLQYAIASRQAAEYLDTVFRRTTAGRVAEAALYARSAEHTLREALEFVEKGGEQDA
ncbi:MAG: hypothetical protein ACRDGE_07950 [Candidatus Limnocylindria bacterium]